MRHLRPLVFVSTLFTVAAAAMWGLAIAAIAGMPGFDPGVRQVDLAGAVAATGVTALCWAVRRQERRDAEKQVLLIRTLAASVSARKPPTRPLPRVL